jgi:HEAT repeat protein
LGGPEVVDALEKAALTDEDHRVRAWAADALYGIHRSAIKRQAYTEIPLASLVAALVAEMNSEWSDHLDWRRIIMREIVRRFREEEEAPDLLISLLTDDVMFVRDISALMLGFIKRPEAINPLARAMFADDDAGVRAQAASSLERIGTPAALAALKAWLKEFEPTIEKRLTVKLLEQSAYGETDAEVMRRLALLADKKGVAQESIRHNYLRGRDRPEERAYLEAAIATYDEGRGPAAALPSWLNQMVAAARRVLQKRRQSAR